MQDQKLTPIPFKVGVVKELTPKAAEGYWINADKVRFRFGKAELMGGWQNVTTSVETTALWGQPRQIETVRTADGVNATIIGTHVGVFSTDMSSYFDITPLVTTLTSTDILSTSVDSTRVVMSLTGHGMTNESIIGIVSAATTIGGNVIINVSADVEVFYQISVIDDNSFAFDYATSAAATSLSTGGQITVKLYLPAGRISEELVGGWGTGVWSGAFGWGTSPGGSYSQAMRLWSFDTWGTEILAVPSQGHLYIWQPQLGLSTRLAEISAAPSIGNIVKVTDARHVVLYGTHDELGVYDPLLIRWCSQEDYEDWAVSINNTAGDYRLPARGSEIISVVETGDKHLILTDTELFAQNYIGGNDVFGFVKLGEYCGSIGRNAAIAYGGILYWMGRNGQFYRYNGRVEPVPCTVLRYIFDNLDPLKFDKIYAGTNSQFDEIIWFYTSKDSPDGENDRYVIFNVIEEHWTIGTLARTVWHDSNVYDHPIAAGVEGVGVFYHEVGYADDDMPLTASLQSAYFDLVDGDEIIFTSKVVPDFCCTQTGVPYAGTIQLTLKGRKYPGGTVVEKGPYTLTGTTTKINPRLRTREISIQLDSESIDQPWRMGEFRMALTADGKR